MKLSIALEELINAKYFRHVPTLSPLEIQDVFCKMENESRMKPKKKGSSYILAYCVDCYSDNIKFARVDDYSFLVRHSTAIARRECCYSRVYPRDWLTMYRH